MSAPDAVAAPGAPGAPGGERAAPAASPALQVDRASASYGPYRALFDVSFTVPAGGVVALLGSNGAGKSTVARVVTGLVPCTAGSLQVAGRDVTGQPAYRIARAGVAHVAFRQRAGRRAVAASLANAYEAFPVLGDRRKQRGGTLSGGQQRLLSLAKVLVVPPRLLVADELSLGLAPVVVDAVYEGLREINRAGTALLVVEQQVDRALALADRAVVLEHGTVAFAGPSADALAAVEKVLAARGERTALLDSGGAKVPPPGPVGPADERRRSRRWHVGRSRHGDGSPGDRSGERGEERG
jgi:branched-chain amino acid transport system ATP-binding protein